MAEAPKSNPEEDKKNLKRAREDDKLPGVIEELKKAKIEGQVNNSPQIKQVNQDQKVNDSLQKG